MKLFHVALTSIICLPFAFADPLTLNTGLDSFGNLITADLGCDAHWTVSGTAVCSGAAAQIVKPNDVDWGGWFADGPNSDWIIRNASTWQNGSPLHTFTVRFWLDDTTGASLSGNWTIDDAGVIALNGHTLGSIGGAPAIFHSVSDSTSSDFPAGWNALTITMTSSDNFLEGVRFEGAVTGDGASFAAPVPEPASLGLLGTLVPFAGMLIRRRKQSA